jgi:hypothetical protein
MLVGKPETIFRDKLIRDTSSRHPARYGEKTLPMTAEFIYKGTHPPMVEGIIQVTLLFYILLGCAIKEEGQIVLESKPEKCQSQQFKRIFPFFLSDVISFLFFTTELDWRRLGGD